MITREIRISTTRIAVLMPRPGASLDIGGGWVVVIAIPIGRSEV